MTLENKTKKVNFLCEPSLKKQIEEFVARSHDYDSEGDFLRKAARDLLRKEARRIQRRA